MMQSDLLGGAHRAASEIFHKRDAFFSGKRGKIGGGWRFDKATHKKIAPMHFQNERGLFADGARIICERRFVGRAYFAQFRAARLQDFADSKASADLHEFAARDDDFWFVPPQT